jgi:hypothetical protein
MAKIHDIGVHQLRPTQVTVGMVEVRDKMKRLKELRDHPHHLKEFIAEHAMPVVEGPEQNYFVIDHHHLGRALWEVELDGASLEVVATLAKLAEQDFWREMERQHWVHPFDEKGHRLGFDQIPHHVKSLRDDPYRSLAAYVRNAGGYDKSQKPFAEFVWADFFRSRVAAALVRDDFDKAVLQALAFAGSAAAAKMPGFIERK